MGGWTTAAASPIAVPMAMATVALRRERSPRMAQTSVVAAQAEATLAQASPAMVAQGTAPASPNSRTRAAVSAQPAAMVVSCRWSMRRGLNVAARNSARNAAAFTRVAISRAMPQ